MSAFLYTWNPKRWAWLDQADAIARVNDGEPYDMYWSCGNTKRILVGDIFFLMRLGVEPKGIVGCGYISSTPYALPHWDEKKSSEGQLALRTDLLFKALTDQPIVGLDELVRRYPDYNWTPQGGGQSIPEHIAQELFSEAQANPTSQFSTSTPAEIKLYVEGKSRTITFKTYDRSPLARQACIAHYGYDCAVCGFNFKETYGEMGATYVEVHHLKQIADIGEEYLIDPVKDLRPVCANCHRMLHRTRPALSIEELMHNLSVKRDAPPASRLRAPYLQR
jgi:5-methylcytosine-specific restriction protein A